MKRILALLLIFSLCFSMLVSLSACKKEQDKDEERYEDEDGKDQDDKDKDEEDESEETDNAENNENTEASGDATYQVTIMGINDVPLADVEVYVFSDINMNHMAGVATTDENGLATLTLEEGEYYIALGNVSTAYTCDLYYAFEGKTAEIILPLMHSGYFVSVEDETGEPVPNAQVRIYTDDTLSEILYSGTTNGSGCITYEADYVDTYTVEVIPPVGYTYAGDNIPVCFGKEMYVAVSLKKDKFAVTTVDGRQFSLSEELETKDAVLALFWFNYSEPCNMLFDQLQAVYGPYADKVTVLALNSIDTEFPTEKEAYPFEFAMVPMSFTQEWNITAYPSYVLFDRNGVLAYTDVGCLDDSDTWVNILDYFTKEDYQSQTVTLEDILG